MSFSSTLSQDLLTSQGGINLKWVNVGLSTVKEVSLIYFKNSDDADIVNVDIAAGLLRYFLASGFVSGQSYSFQLQVVDISNNMVFSNTLVLVAPWFLTPPEITGVSGSDSALNVQLASTTNIVSASDTTVEFVLKRSDNVVFWIIKPYANAGMYSLSSADNPSLTNNVTYRIACMFQPTSTVRYTAPSNMSNSLTATPSTIPNISPSVRLRSTGTTSLQLRVDWDRPTDYGEWYGDNFSVHLKLLSSLGTEQDFVLAGSAGAGGIDIWYIIDNLEPGQSYRATVSYINRFGEGPSRSSAGFVAPTKAPDAPVLVSVSDDDLQSVIQWSAPEFNGQSDISGYGIYKDGTLLTTLGTSARNYTVTGLMNGYSYAFKVVAINAIGSSVDSNVISANPYGAMSIVSGVVSGKILTITINPNGRPTQNVVLVALEADPNNAADSDFVVTIPQQQISQITTQNITVIKNFSTFSSDISFYCAIVQNETGSVFLKSA
jgi:hypothetical protein